MIPMRKKPWPFVGQSLFIYDPGHDTEDRQVFDHVLNTLKRDFGITIDSDSPRMQILLDDVVDSVSRLATLRSKANPDPNESDETVRYPKERKIRDEIRKALLAIMNFTNPRKVQKTVSIEGLLNKLGADE